MNLANTNIVESVNGELLVTSEVIANNTGVQHKNILETIAKYSHLFKKQPAFETRDGYNGIKTKVALLDEHQSTSLITLMRNSDKVVEFKFALVDEFFRMKQALNDGGAKDLQPSWIANLSPQATIAIEDMNRQIETLADKVAEDAPKVELFNKIVDHGESKCFRDVAAQMGVKQGFLTSTLLIKKIIYKKGKEYRAYSEFAKYFDLKTGLNNYTDKDGNAQSKEYNQLRVNTEGLAYLIKRFANPELKALEAK